MAHLPPIPLRQRRDRPYLPYVKWPRGPAKHLPPSWIAKSLYPSLRACRKHLITAFFTPCKFTIIRPTAALRRRSLKQPMLWIRHVTDELIGRFTGLYPAENQVYNLSHNSQATSNFLTFRETAFPCFVVVACLFVCLFVSVSRLKLSELTFFTWCKTGHRYNKYYKMPLMILEWGCGKRCCLE